MILPSFKWRHDQRVPEVRYKCGVCCYVGLTCGAVGLCVGLDCRAIRGKFGCEPVLEDCCFVFVEGGLGGCVTSPGYWWDWVGVVVPRGEGL